MTIAGIGVDIVEIERIQNVIERFGARFLKKIFTEAERTYCLNKQNPYSSFAARFAAKEAFSKAIGTGIGKYIGFRDIEVILNEQGKPSIVLSSKAALLFPKITHIHLSLSHSDTQAIAFVITETSP